MKKRLLSLFLALAIMLSLVVIPTYANDTTPDLSISAVSYTVEYDEESEEYNLKAGSSVSNLSVGDTFALKISFTNTRSTNAVYLRASKMSFTFDNSAFSIYEDENVGSLVSGNSALTVVGNDNSGVYDIEVASTNGMKCTANTQKNVCYVLFEVQKGSGTYNFDLSTNYISVSDASGAAETRDLDSPVCGSAAVSVIQANTLSVTPTAITEGFDVNTTYGALKDKLAVTYTNGAGEQSAVTDYTFYDAATGGTQYADTDTMGTAGEKTIYVEYQPGGEAVVPARVPVTVTVGKGEQDTLTLTTTSTTYGQNLILETSGGSGTGDVTYAVTAGTGTASISDNVLTPTQAGTVTVTATKAGDTDFKEISSDPTTVTIARADYTYNYGKETDTVTVGTSYPASSKVEASGVGTEKVSGTLAWYTNAERTEEAGGGTFGTVGEKTLYWKFTPDETNTNYNTTPTTGSVVYTVSALPTQDVSFDVETVDKTYGEGGFSKAATNNSEGGGAITYSSSNTNVATVHESTGAVTIVGAGTAVITATAAKVPTKYAETTATYTLTVSPKTLTAAMIGDIAAQTYSGQELKPAVTVTDSDPAITADDYTVSYSNNVNAGTGTVTIIGQNNYIGTVTKDFTINPKPVTPTVTVTGTYTYNGTAQTPTYTVMDTSVDPAVELVKDRDYTETLSNNTDTGEATLTITAKEGGNYAFTALSESFAIAPIQLTAAKLIWTGGNITKTYDGNTSCNSVTALTITGTGVATVDGQPITGTAVYNAEDVKDANKITFTPNAITTGNYVLAATETKELAATITPVVLTADNLDYTGDLITKKYDGTNSGGEAKLTITGHSVSALNDKQINGTYLYTGVNAGTNTATFTPTPVTVADKENYTIAATETTTITAEITATDQYTANVNAEQNVVVRDGSFAEPTFTGIDGETVAGTLSYAYGGESEKTAADIKTILAGLTKGQKATINYTFTPEDGNYTGDKNGKIDVTMIDILFYVEEGAVTVEPSPVYGDTWADLITIDQSRITARVGETEISGTYTLNQSGMPNAGAEQDYSVLFTSDDETYQSVTVVSGKVSVAQKEIIVTPSADQQKTYGETDPVLAYNYDGAVEGQTPAFDGSLSREAGEAVGTYLVEKGTLALKDDTGFTAANYTLKLDETPVYFTIQKQPLDATMISEITPVTYNGQEQKPELTVSIGEENYTVSYSDNISAGTATVTITATEEGNYSGSAGKTFTINRKPAVLVWSGADTRTYDGEESNVTATVGNLETGDTCVVTVENGTGKTADTYTATATELSNANYKLPEDGIQDCVYVIDKAKLTPTVVSVNPKVYDGTPIASGTLALTGAVSGEQPTAAGIFAWTAKAAGTTTVNVIDIALNPAWTTNYEVSETSLSAVTAPDGATIERKELTILGVRGIDRATDGTKAVGLTGGTLNGVIDGDDIDFDLPSGTMKDADTGSRKAVMLDADITLNGADRDNYTLIQPTDVTVNIFAAQTIVAEPEKKPTVEIPATATQAVRNVATAIQNGENIAEADVLKEGSNAVISDQKTVNQAISDAAENAAIKKLIDDDEITEADIQIAAVPYVGVEVISASTEAGSKEITVDISAMYQIKATAGTAVDVSIGDPVEMAVNEPIELTIPLPTGFASPSDEIPVKHTHDGKEYLYIGTVNSEGAFEFTALYGLSEFTLVPSQTTVASIDGRNGGTIYFETLSDAIGEVQNGETITLKAGLADKVSAEVSREITFKLDANGNSEDKYSITAGNGYELTVNGNEYKFTEQQDDTVATITRGSKTLSYTSLQSAVDAVKNNETIKLKDGLTGKVSATISREITFTLDANGNDGDKYSITAGSGYKLSISGDTYTVTKTGGSSGGGGGGVTTYRASVTTPTNGTIKLSRTNASKGDTVTITLTPDEGYVVDTVTVKDADGNTIKATKESDTVYKFTMPSGKVTVSATFKAATENGKATLPFTDVQVGNWFYDAVAYAYENGLMNGISNTEFAPNGTTTRAMVVTILWRMAGSPVVDYAMPFTDVPADQWYTEAVRWAASTGVVTGVSATRFDPDGYVTREALTTMLYRTQKDSGEIGDTQITQKDANRISSWAREAMQWAVKNGVLKGDDKNQLNPQSNATRAEIATVFRNLAK